MTRKSARVERPASAQPPSHLQQVESVPKGLRNASWRLQSPALVGAALLALLAPAAALAADRATSDITNAAFWFLAALTVLSAAGVAFSRNILYSSFALLGALLGVAGLYVLLSADFLAVAQVLIYIGGVLVLILFAVMLTSRIEDVKISNQALGVLPAAGATVATVGLLVYVVFRAPWKIGRVAPDLKPTAASLGDLFLDKYLLPFEIASVVLLATLIGAVVIARKEIKPE